MIGSGLGRDASCLAPIGGEVNRKVLIGGGLQRDAVIGGYARMCSLAYCVNVIWRYFTLRRDKNITWCTVNARNVPFY